MPAMRHAQNMLVQSDKEQQEKVNELTVVDSGLDNTFYHVVNRGTQSKKVFVDDNDNESFKKFLKDYLDVPPHPETYRKEFTIKGKIYKGIPHKSKNYFGQISLIAYSFDDSHFHLLLSKTKAGSIERFMRSLLTRYSMYYNKKHSSKGSLFEGPYKSILVEGNQNLITLSKYINSSGKYNSINNYIGDINVREQWVSTNILEKIYNETENINSKKYNYCQYIQKVKFSEEDNKLLERISLDPYLDTLERIPNSLERSSKISHAHKNEDLIQDNTYYEPIIRPSPNFAFVRAITFVSIFLFLFNFSLQKVIKNQDANASDNHQEVLGVKKQEPPTEQIIITTNYQNTKINIYLDQDIDSKVVYQAKNNEQFELISSSKNWYQILLPDGSKGYLINSYAQRTH